MRYTPDHKARTRERVLAAAAAAIRTDGPDRLGVAAVMAGAGLTHGGFYAHFRSRDDLLAGTVGFMADQARVAFHADVAAVDPRAGLQRFVDRYLSLRHCQSRDAGCPIPILSGDLHRLPAAARQPFNAAVERMIAGVADLLDRLERPDARQRATSAVAEMVGAVTLARAAADPAVAEALLECTRASVEAKLGLR
jgi:TetR/AcrR family transcriptional repressor of nem operon